MVSQTKLRVNPDKHFISNKSIHSLIFSIYLQRECPHKKTSWKDERTSEPSHVGIDARAARADARPPDSPKVHYFCYYLRSRDPCTEGHLTLALKVT